MQREGDESSQDKHTPSGMDWRGGGMFIPPISVPTFLKTILDVLYLQKSVQEFNFLLKFLTKFSRKGYKREWDGFL